MPRVDRGRLVAEPKVYVIGVQALHAPGLRDFLTDEGFPGWATSAETAAEILPEVAGRLCYLSFAGGREHPEYIANLKRERHGSVLEHAVVTFVLTGVSRTLTHELVRHRAGWSYSQLSQRYVDERDCQVVCPAAVAACKGDPDWHHVYDEWVRVVQTGRNGYRFVCNELEHKLGAGSGGLGHKFLTALRKTVRGSARSLLPGSAETKIACTVNARALRHFLEMRASQAADLEIRQVALLIYHAVLPFMPDVLGDYVERMDDNGDVYLTTETTKV